MVAKGQRLLVSTNSETTSSGCAPFEHLVGGNDAVVVSLVVVVVVLVVGLGSVRLHRPRPSSRARCLAW